MVHSFQGRVPHADDLHGEFQLSVLLAQGPSRFAEEHGELHRVASKSKHAASSQGPDAAGAPHRHPPGAASRHLRRGARLVWLGGSHACTTLVYCAGQIPTLSCFCGEVQSFQGAGQQGWVQSEVPDDWHCLIVPSCTVAVRAVTQVTPTKMCNVIL